MLRLTTPKTPYARATVAEIVKRGLPGFEEELLDVVSKFRAVQDADDYLLARLYHDRRLDQSDSRAKAIEIVRIISDERKLAFTREEILPQVQSIHPVVQARALAEMAHLFVLEDLTDERKYAVASIQNYLKKETCFELAEAELFAALLVLDEIPDDSVSQLGKMLKSRSEAIRIVACRCLERLGPKAQSALPTLWKTFNTSKNSTAAFEAISAIRRKKGVKPEYRTQAEMDRQRERAYKLLVSLRGGLE